MLSGSSSSIRTKLWWNSHLMVLFQNCVWQSHSPTKMAATGQLHCYWKQFWCRWAITGFWEPLVLYCIVLKVWFWLCDLQDSSFTIKGQRILWLVYYLQILLCLIFHVCPKQRYGFLLFCIVVVLVWSNKTDLARCVCHLLLSYAIFNLHHLCVFLKGK
jgi:hypothetical protein